MGQAPEEGCHDQMVCEGYRDTFDFFGLDVAWWIELIAHVVHDQLPGVHNEKLCLSGNRIVWYDGVQARPIVQLSATNKTIRGKDTCDLRRITVCRTKHRNKSYIVSECVSLVGADTEHFLIKCVIRCLLISLGQWRWMSLFIFCSFSMSCTRFLHQLLGNKSGTNTVFESL